MDATATDPLVGRLVDGRYQVTSRLARGGMATVYLATDLRLDRDVALKVMHPHLAEEEPLVARFHREATSAARVSHPNVVAVYDQGRDGATVYLAMEHVAGTTLREEMTARGPMSAGTALSLLEPVLDALAAAHRAGVVHRDVKPENVLLTADGRVKVADFGLARGTGPAATATATATTGVLLGTVAYLAPELLQRGVADARADVYAAGVMLFEMVTGRQPFTGEVAAQVAYRHVLEMVPAPSTVAAGVPPQIDDLLAWCTARDPDQRPSDARELLHEVRELRSRLSPDELARVPVPLGALAPAVGGWAGGQTLVVDPTAATRPTRPTQAVPGAGPAGPAGGPGPGGPEDWGYGPAGRRRRGGLVALVALLVVVVGLGTAGWYFGAGPGAWTSTPDVVGQERAAAEQLLADAGLGSSVAERFDETAPVGQVVATDPAPGADVRRDASVTLFVSRGSEFVATPELTGRTLAEATALAADADLVVTEGEPQYDERVPEGAVAAQEPAATERLRRGETVTVALSLGRRPVDVPALTGLTLEKARRVVQDSGLTLAEGTPESSEDVPAGTVIRQSPEDGTLFGGGAVTVVVSSGPPLVAVPDVVGQQVGPATRALEGAGFRVKVDRVLGGFFGTVRQQDPAAGTQVRIGSTVTLTIV